MSTETTNKKIKIDNGTTFGKVYTDKAVDELLKNMGGSESVEDLPVVELTEETTSVTDETIREKILENVNNNKYLICKLKMTLLVPIEILITRDTKITSNDNTINTTYSVISNLDLGIVSSTVNFILIINKDNTIVVKYSDFGYVKGNHISLAENNIKSTGIGVTTDFGDTDYINGTTFYFDTINGNKIYHTADYEIIDHTIPETKSISIFGNHNILVPKNSADANILPLPADASNSTYVLKAVNGTVQWVKES